MEDFLREKVTNKTHKVYLSTMLHDYNIENEIERIKNGELFHEYEDELCEMVDKFIFKDDRILGFALDSKCMKLAYKLISKGFTLDNEDHVNSYESIIYSISIGRKISIDNFETILDSEDENSILFILEIIPECVTKLYSEPNLLSKCFFSETLVINILNKYPEVAGEWCVRFAVESEYIEIIKLLTLNPQIKGFELFFDDLKPLFNTAYIDLFDKIYYYDSDYKLLRNYPNIGNILFDSILDMNFYEDVDIFMDKYISGIQIVNRRFDGLKYNLKVHLINGKYFKEKRFIDKVFHEGLESINHGKNLQILLECLINLAYDFSGLCPKMLEFIKTYKQLSYHIKDNYWNKEVADQMINNIKFTFEGFFDSDQNNIIDIYIKITNDQYDHITQY